MKTISDIVAAGIRLLSAALLLVAACRADSPDVGFIRFVNAIGPGRGNARLVIGAEELFPQGYATGQCSGGIGLKAGTHRITVAREGLEPGKTEVAIASGATTTLVAFAEELPGDHGKPKRWGIRVLRLPQRDAGKGCRLTLLNVTGQAELQLVVRSPGRPRPDTLSVKRLMTASPDPVDGSGGFDIRLPGAKTRLAFLHPDEPGHHVLILYEDAAGELRALHFPDPRFTIAG